MPTQTIDDLDTPSLIVDMDIMERNLRRMANFTRECHVDLRPHVKTHKIPEIAKLQLDGGAKGVCLQRLSEAEVFADHGITDIFITNEVVGNHKYPKPARLADRIHLKVAVDNYDNAVEISKACSEIGTEIKVLVDVDVGLHRCGVLPIEAGDLADKVARLKNLVFTGIMGYDGHAKGGKTKEEREKIPNEAMDQIAIAQKEIKRRGHEIKVTSVGLFGQYMDRCQATRGYRGSTWNVPFQRDKFDRGRRSHYRRLCPNITINCHEQTDRGSSHTGCGEQGVSLRPLCLSLARWA